MSTDKVERIAETVVDETVYPMWVIVCARCGVVGTVFEKPGTGCHYVRHCFYCGGEHVRDERVESYSEAQRVKEREAAKHRRDS